MSKIDTSAAGSKTHDYSNEKRRWGHDYSFRPTDPEGLTGVVHGWGRGIAAGDYMLLGDAEGTSRYRIKTITYAFNPTDQFKADVEFAPRGKDCA